MNPGATVIVTHHVRDAREKDYQVWLNEIGSVCKTYPGFLDLQIIRPIAGMTYVYTIIIRFDTQENLLKWVNSPERKNLHEKAKDLLSKDIDSYVRSGLDFWFTTGTNAPTRWKQFLVTWSALVPLNLTLSFLITPPLHALGLERNSLIRIPLVAAIALLLMVYVIMPAYTQRVRKWLYK
jgi:hypothetical protein